MRVLRDLGHLLRCRWWSLRTGVSVVPVLPWNVAGTSLYEANIRPECFPDGVGFFVIATAIGVLLRVHVLRPIPGLNYAFVLHAHSHTAFLGWVYNAFFALALHFFVPPSERGRFARLFVITQIATVGMLVTFPLQGYARESIAFSTLHMACSGLFAWRLLRLSSATPTARMTLGWAFGFMFLSAVGPLALGGIAAVGLRESPWYSMAIYFYLHFQYNGWFVFFLLAVLLQWHHRTGGGESTSAPRITRAVHWLATGCILTLTLSALWMAPPRWVHVIGILGGAVQIVGVGFLARALAGSGASVQSRLARGLMRAAAGAFLLKLGLQALGGWPTLAALVTQRMVVVGFLHLVFLVVVTPMLLAWSVELGWMRLRPAGWVGLALLSVGTIVTEVILFLPPALAFLPWIPVLPRVYELLAIVGGLIFAGVGLLLTSFRTRGPAVRPADEPPRAP